MELDLEEGGRVNIVRAGRLQRSKDKHQRRERGRRWKIGEGIIMHLYRLFGNQQLKLFPVKISPNRTSF